MLGKDRTGTLSALILLALGMSCVFYLQTNKKKEKKPNELTLFILARRG
jgi:protein tyrosine/serine phosphatase